MAARLLPVLASAIGREQASRELIWIQRAVDSRETSLTLDEIVRRRAGGEPLQYILGTQPFGPLNLLTRPPVLIPRPETEHWVTKLAETVRPSAQKPISLLDLGTGSGCIPLLLCHLWPAGSVKAHAVDISPHALALAQENAQRTGILPHSDHEKKPRNTFTTSMANLLAEDFPDTASRSNSPFDVITSNPPYIPWKEYLKLLRSVSDFEDPKALFGGPSGLEFYHAISRLILRSDLLKPDGIVALEVGHDQADAVEALMRDTGRFRRTEIWLDPWGKQRTVIARP